MARRRRTDRDERKLDGITQAVAASERACEVAEREVERVCALAERQVAKAEARAETPPPPTPSFDGRLRAIEQKVDDAVRSIDHPGSIGTRARTWIAAWRRRRRHRSMVRRLDRMLDRRDTRIVDQTSAALLAVLTERVARMSTCELSVAELERTTAIAQRVADEFRTYVARLAHVRDSATPGATDLRNKAIAELARCQASLRRIDDALAQLHLLMSRKAALRSDVPPPHG